MFLLHFVLHGYLSTRMPELVQLWTQNVGL